MTTQMRISADNDYRTDFDGGHGVGTVVNVRPYFNSEVPELKYEFEDPDRPGTWLCCEARELDPLEPEPDLQAQIDALTEHYTQLLEVKDAALKIAAYAFAQYGSQHLAKGTPESTMKAFTNIGLERTMLDALEAD